MGTATPLIKRGILKVVNFACFDSKMSYKLTLNLTQDTKNILYTQKQTTRTMTAANMKHSSWEILTSFNIDTSSPKSVHVRLARLLVSAGNTYNAKLSCIQLLNTEKTYILWTLFITEQV